MRREGRLTDEPICESTGAETPPDRCLIPREGSSSMKEPITMITSPFACLYETALPLVVAVLAGKCALRVDGEWCSEATLVDPGRRRRRTYKPRLYQRMHGCARKQKNTSCMCNTCAHIQCLRRIIFPHLFKNASVI